MVVNLWYLGISNVDPNLRQQEVLDSAAMTKRSKHDSVPSCENQGSKTLLAKFIFEQ